MNPWAITIGGGIIVGLAVSFIQDFQQQQLVFSTLLSWGKSIWHWIILFLNFNIKVWWLLVGICGLICVIILLTWLYNLFHTQDNTIQPDFLSYTQDTLCGWRCEWNWERTYNGQYQIQNLRLICSACSTPLINNQGYMNKIHCIRCNKEYSLDNYPDEKELCILIEDNVRKGLFKPNSRESTNES